MTTDSLKIVAIASVLLVCLAIAIDAATAPWNRIGTGKVVCKNYYPAHDEVRIVTHNDGQNSYTMPVIDHYPERWSITVNSNPEQFSVDVAHQIWSSLASGNSVDIWQKQGLLLNYGRSIAEQK